VVFATFAICVFLKTKRIYEQVRTLPLWLSICWWVTDAAWTFLVTSSSLYNVWLLPIERTAALISGLALLVIGSALTLAGIIEFRPIRRVSGMEVSILITTGVYSWSRESAVSRFLPRTTGNIITRPLGLCTLSSGDSHHMLPLLYCKGGGALSWTDVWEGIFSL